jgi:ATP-dependent DNA helicase DinG
LKDCDDILGIDGPLARSLPGFAPRDEQLEMARCVAQALSALEPLVVEAGTGTGKTFAYLVPALLSGRHAIISTGTRTLQDQLYHRDLPAVSAALGRPVKVALLKGRANYLCKHRLGLSGAEVSLSFREIEPAALERVAEWSRRTRSGDISELAGLPENDPVWPAVTSTRENCLGTECPAFSECHVVAARRAAQAADIVIVNHHLLLADLALKEGGFGDLLPGTEAVILDEAHQIPEIAAQFFGASLGARQIQSLVRDVNAELRAAHLGSASIDSSLRELEELIGEFRHALPRGEKRIEWSALSAMAAERLADLEARLQALRQSLDTLGGTSAGLGHCVQRAAELASRCADLRSADEESGVRWIEAHASGWTLQFTPFEIASRLQQFITGQACAWIFTSATLAVGEDFTHFTRRIGVPEARTVHIDSPFDYRRQALLYLPEKMSDPSDPGHARHVLEGAWPLLEAAGGRAFILFTSHRALAEAAAWMKVRATDLFPVLIQGEAPREQLLRRFRELGNAVLLGTGSFWEGVDVKGQALSLVVIDKLPFASPDDPVLAARLEAIRRRGGNPFFEYQLPQAVLALKQGVGRLIRDAADAGVVMICDPRLMTRRYGSVFIQSLPPMPATTNLREAVALLERVTSQP